MTKKEKKMGRPKIEINWDEFKKLCLMQCTIAEIADWFKCSVDTIQKRCYEVKKTTFTAYFKKNASAGKISLRRAQFKSATGGNVSMLIWLGKQYLNQKDNPDLFNKQDESAQPIKIEIVGVNGRKEKTNTPDEPAG